MSRSWLAVPKAIQKLAIGLHDVKSEGMFPFEMHYVLATDEEVGATLRFRKKCRIALCAHKMKSRIGLATPHGES